MKSRICIMVGDIIFKRFDNASRYSISPVIADFVLKKKPANPTLRKWSLHLKKGTTHNPHTYIAFTSSDLPQYAANSSIASFWITVESTSKHTASTFFKTVLTSSFILLRKIFRFPMALKKVTFFSFGRQNKEIKKKLKIN